MRHSSEELFCVLQGQTDFRVGDQRASATPGMLVMVPRGTPHAPGVVGRERARILVMFAPAGPEGRAVPQ
ncbi:cupin domain-containing protein [Streptomyces sp. NPDC060275]|uniref:cupin domain-containing protein n=1 Tax=Streptomyces sp. NPDC060275 TaxID=3347090 RepID=UPI00365A7A4F